jgi:hypothetical protein
MSLTEPLVPASPSSLYRVYFNHRAAAPLVWSVDSGTQDDEEAVAEVVIEPGCRTRTRWTGQPSNDKTPVAWLEVEASGGWRLEGAARTGEEGVAGGSLVARFLGREGGSAGSGSPGQGCLPRFIT